MGKPVYLDSHASAPEDPRVTEFCNRFRHDCCGNAASPHLYGKEASEAVEMARASIAHVIRGAKPSEITFMSGATEANNMALRGLKLHHAKSDIVTTSIEHSSILETLKKMPDRNVIVVPVGESGIVDPDDIKRACTARTGLITVMQANNEIGTIQPVKEISDIAKQFEAKFHIDACQSFGRLPLSRDLADLITISAHKCYGPKGVGALYVREGVDIEPLIYGGTQENGMRPGTVNVPGVIGFGMAAYLMDTEWPREAERLRMMRDELLSILMRELGDEIVHINGSMEDRLPHNLNVTLMYVCPQKLNPILIDVCAVSAASACRKTSTGSHVLKAIGAPDNDTGTPIRFGLSRFNTMEEIHRVARCVSINALKLYGVACDIAPHTV